jgi:hypothetical protein
VQGQLRKEHLKADLATECGHCHAPLEFNVTSDLRIDLKTIGAKPLVFEPEIDWPDFTEPNILDAY